MMEEVEWMVDMARDKPIYIGFTSLFWLYFGSIYRTTIFKKRKGSQTGLPWEIYHQHNHCVFLRALSYFRYKLLY